MGWSSKYGKLGGGLKHVLFSSLFGEMIHVDWYFLDGLKETTNQLWIRTWIVRWGIYKWSFFTTIFGKIFLELVPSSANGKLVVWGWVVLDSSDSLMNGRVALGAPLESLEVQTINQNTTNLSLPGTPSVLFSWGNFTPKTSNYCLKHRTLGVPD